MIHPTAIIDASARIASDVEIGPYSIIGKEVEIGAGTWIGPHAVVQGPTVIGQRNKIFQFASIGEIPQDKKFIGEQVFLEIGDDNVFREFTTVNRGTGQGGSYTKIADRNLFMAYTHVAHDCLIGNDNIFANYAALAGHVTVEDFVIFGGYAGVAQFCRVGAHSFACANSVINKDVLPFTLVSGFYAKPHGLNSIGLKRRGFSESVLSDLNHAYKIIFRQNFSLEEALQKLRDEFKNVVEIQQLVHFIELSQQGFAR